MMKLVIANWKMNPLTVRDAGKLARASDAKGVVVCPPFLFLEAVGRTLRRAVLGAQDTFWEERGPYTGEVSPLQLKRLGVRYVIVGHSERRRVFGETDAMVAKKVAVVIRTGLTPILCVGETKAERAAGITKRVIARQLKVGLSLNPSAKGGSPPEANGPSSEGGSASGGRAHASGGKPYTLYPRIIIAYEPVWAIGAGVADKPEDTARVAAFIRSQLRAPRVRVLYGGSVNVKNARAFLERAEIGGALVGGASLHVRTFMNIIAIARSV